MQYHVILQSSRIKCMPIPIPDQNAESCVLSLFKTQLVMLVYDLKYVGSLEIEFVAPIPEQLRTITMHLFGDSWAS